MMNYKGNQLLFLFEILCQTWLKLYLRDINKQETAINCKLRIL